MKAISRYDISEARVQIEQGKTTYRKLVEITERVETDTWTGFVMQGTGKFELREVSREEFYS